MFNVRRKRSRGAVKMLTEKDKAYIDGYITGYTFAMSKLQQTLSQLCEYSYLTYLRNELEKGRQCEGERNECLD